MSRNNEGNIQAPVPLYTKIGWGVAWVVMLVILTMILRNCVTSVYYGRKTEPQQVEVYHKLGVSDGVSGKGPALPGEGRDNPVLRKAYSKGYREGVDQGRQVPGDQ